MFTICIPILNQHSRAAKYLDSWFALAKGRLDVLFIDNGSDEAWRDDIVVKSWVDEGHRIRCLRNDKNTGVYSTFQQGYNYLMDCGATTPRWIFFSHSDVEMLVPGWDVRLRELLELAESRNAGVSGMFGAKGIGTPDIYRVPYHYTQLVRWGCHTVESMVDAGGTLVTEDLTPCMVLDGFSLILSTEMISAVGGFDHERYPVHHCYDQRICLKSHFAGYNNFVLDLDCKHHGGMTSTHEKWAEAMGTTDLKIHRAAHKVFYEEFRGQLPVSVK